MPIKVPAAENGYQQPRERKRTPGSPINSTIRGIDGMRKARRAAKFDKLLGPRTTAEQDATLDAAEREAKEARAAADEAKRRAAAR
jgi:hypothetical protein